MNRRIMTIMALALLWMGMPAIAQTENTQQTETFGERFTRLAKKTVKEMEKAGHSLGDAIGFDDRVNPVEDEGDSVRIGSTYYMPLYTTNLYKGSDARIYIDECRKRFKERFPEAEIQSVALPQTQWVSSTLKRGNKVVSYTQTMYCYVLAKDGDDGYINARFSFTRTKQPGSVYKRETNGWPKWERTDVIPMADYQQMSK